MMKFGIVGMHMLRLSFENLIGKFRSTLSRWYFLAAQFLSLDFDEFDFVATMTIQAIRWNSVWLDVLYCQWRARSFDSNRCAIVTFSIEFQNNFSTIDSTVKQKLYDEHVPSAWNLMYAYVSVPQRIFMMANLMRNLLNLEWNCIFLYE